MHSYTALENYFTSDISRFKPKKDKLTISIAAGILVAVLIATVIREVALKYSDCY